MTTAYTITRPMMTAAELTTHQAAQYGRNYAESDDGYSDMEAEEGRGWHALASWGRDGWDLGTWPYVMIYTRTTSGRFEPHDPGGRWELMSIVEGDRDVYRFVTEADRDAATDYLFLWYAAGQRWAPLGYEDRAKLDAGKLAVDEKFRGPYRDERAA
jgi:hypothetical protein